MVQNKTEKVQSELTEKIQSNKRETELDVSFMVNSMVEIYEQLDRKNADKVYSILSKESVECFNIKLHPISPPLAPSASVETSVTQTDSSKSQSKKLRSQTLKGY